MEELEVQVDPTFLLMSAEMYWRDAMDPKTIDYFHREWVIRSWYVLLLWVAEIRP